MGWRYELKPLIRSLARYAWSKVDRVLSVCVWLITCPLYWTGCLANWCLLSRRAEFKKAGVTDNLAKE